jgi:hypothetical protein
VGEDTGWTGGDRNDVDTGTLPRSIVMIDDTIIEDGAGFDKPFRLHITSDRLIAIAACLTAGSARVDCIRGGRRARAPDDR